MIEFEVVVETNSTSHSVCLIFQATTFPSNDRVTKMPLQVQCAQCLHIWEMTETPQGQQIVCPNQNCSSVLKVSGPPVETSSKPSGETLPPPPPTWMTNSTPDSSSNPTSSVKKQHTGTKEEVSMESSHRSTTSSSHRSSHLASGTIQRKSLKEVVEQCGDETLCSSNIPVKERNWKRALIGVSVSLGLLFCFILIGEKLSEAETHSKTTQDYTSVDNASRFQTLEENESSLDSVLSTTVFIKKSAKDEGYKEFVHPFLTKYCADCHSSDDGDFNLTLFPNDRSLDDRKHHNAWGKVIQRLEIGAMPPPDAEEMPTPAEVRSVVQWLEKRIFQIDCDLEYNPGRVTIRRLNRNEYNNTIRDLMGVDFQPANDFPSDDVGAGFDNIADVLSLPPLLMEKYLDAAEAIAERAIKTPDELQTHFKFRPNHLHVNGANKSDRAISFSSSGEAWIPLPISHSGDFTIRIEAYAQQAGKEPAKLELKIDQKTVKVFDTKGYMKPEIYQHRVTLPKGNSRLSVHFPNDFYQPQAKNPKDRDRNLYVKGIEVVSDGQLSNDKFPASHRKLVIARPNLKAEPKITVQQAARKVLKNFIPKAWRRPVSDEEISPIVKLVEKVVASGESYERGLQIGVQAVLVSPHFLFRIEQDAEQPNQNRTLNDYELAVRLSYFLWSSMPDDELFALAEQKQLHRPEVLEKQVHRMIQDPKSQSLVDHFAGQWLNLRNLDEITPDRERFPAFSKELRADMKRETLMLFERIMKDDLSVLDLLNANYSYLNERLAKHYGIPGVQGKEFRKISLQTTPRRGVLGHGSILTLTSNPTRTSPVKRGKWIMENLLGTPPPQAPGNAPPLEEAAKANPNLSLREQLAQHREDPSCATCHVTMDQLGFGFENFDAVGQWRTKDGRFQIDPSGELPDGRSFKGPVELVDILVEDRQKFIKTFSKKMLIYALGRDLRYYDHCAIDRILEVTEKNDYRFSVLCLEIVKSKPFQMRKSEGEDL